GGGAGGVRVGEGGGPDHVAAEQDQAGGGRGLDHPGTVALADPGVPGGEERGGHGDVGLGRRADGQAGWWHGDQAVVASPDQLELERLRRRAGPVIRWLRRRAGDGPRPRRRSGRAGRRYRVTRRFDRAVAEETHPVAVAKRHAAMWATPISAHADPPAITPADSRWPDPGCRWLRRTSHWRS